MSPSQSPETHYRRVMAKRRPGETLRALAERSGLKPRTFYGWHHSFKARAPKPTPPAKSERGAALVPVDLSTRPGLDLGALLGPSGFEVTLRRSGHVVRVPRTFEPSALARLISVLEEA